MEEVVTLFQIWLLAPGQSLEHLLSEFYVHQGRQLSLEVLALQHGLNHIHVTVSHAVVAPGDG